MKRIVFTLLLFVVLGMNAQNKNYITRVYDFLPAPGQFVNNSPEYNEGEPRDSVLARTLRRLGPKIEVLIDYDEDDNPFVVDTIVKPVTSQLISLGSFGGYVIFGFDHPVVNVEGEYDLQIFGNAFKSDSLAVSGGSSEPGIVMVGVDRDGDGVPGDADQWYELAGSEHGNPRVQRGFEITYYRPDPLQGPVQWTCNSVDSLQSGDVDYIPMSHSQPYWPLWVDSETLTFTGTKLPCNAINRGTPERPYYVQFFFDWGYVDCKPDFNWQNSIDQANQSMQNLGFKLDWAIDNQGRPVNLTKVDFIKVCSALLQECGWIGETSTEVCGAIDLHPDATVPDEPHIIGDINGDGKVDISDVNAVINNMLGKVELIPAADINRDNNVDISDVNAIINLMLGK